MRTKLSLQQKNYMLAKAAVAMAEDNENAYEAKFLEERGHSEPHCWQIDDNNVFESVIHELDDDAEYHRLFMETRAAEERLHEAEERLIDWSLDWVPKSITEKVVPHRNEFSVREKLIDLAFRLDASTIPEQARK